MRIIAGEARGRVIAAPPAGTRPTSDRVRESLFAILDSRIGLEGVRVLDLYAGSGALGLEALSRGAAHATFVESDARAAATITANLTTTALARPSCTVIRRRVDAVLAGAPPAAFDVVFLDPPYALDDRSVAADVAGLVGGGWLTDDAMVIVERSSRSPETVWPAGLDGVLGRSYGETRLDIATVA